MPHTPHTPGGAAATHPLTPGGPPSVSSIYNESNTNSNINANHSSPAQNHSPQHKSNMNNQNLMDNLTSTALANSRNNTGSLVNLAVDLNSDLNFDPAAVIDGNNTNDLNVSICQLLFVSFSFSLATRISNGDFLFLHTAFTR